MNHEELIERLETDANMWDETSDHYKDRMRAAAAIRELVKERDAAREENTRLRAALANSDQPCAYCSLPAEEWAECQSGFPGCARGDDAMGCPELGAAMEREALLGLIRFALAPHVHPDMIEAMIRDALAGGRGDE
jgi:hypothetical protein